MVINEFYRRDDDLLEVDSDWFILVELILDTDDCLLLLVVEFIVLLILFKLLLLSLLLDAAPVVVIVGKELAFVCLFIELVTVDVVELVLVLLLVFIELEYLLYELDEDVVVIVGIVDEVGDVGSSLRGGKRSLTLSRLLASSNEICFLSNVSLPNITLAVFFIYISYD